MSSKNTIIKFATWNVDQARREENYEETKWDNRYESVLKLIEKADADILCIQELRNLDTSKIGVKRFLSLFPENYDFEYAYYSENEHSFALATLYNRTKYYVVNSRRFRYTDRVDEGQICLGLNFVDKETRESFWVYNTHFSIHEEFKWNSVNKVIAELGTTNDKMLIAGDYNFFDDRDGTKQRQKMSEYFIDIAHPLYDSYDNDCKMLSGTFIGFEHDDFKREYENMSRLDHIFSRNIKSSEVAIGFGATEELLRTRKYPSDHLMVRVNVHL